MKTMSRLCVLLLIILIVIPGSVVQAAKPAGGNDRGGIAVPGTGVRSNDTMPAGTDVAPDEEPLSPPPAEEPLLAPVPNEGSVSPQCGDGGCEVEELCVAKDVHLSMARTYRWEIDKWVDKDMWELAPGETVTSTYTVKLDRYVTETEFKIWGTIWIFNPAAVTAEIESIVDMSGDVMATVECPKMTVDPYETLVCTYSAGPYDTKAFGDKNVVTVTTSNDWEVMGDVAEAPIDWSKAEVYEKGHKTVHVMDTWYGDLGEFTDSGTKTYERTFTCWDDEGEHENKAWIVETEQYAKAKVKVLCGVIKLQVEKDAWTSFVRGYKWTIDKRVDVDEWHLFRGDSATSTYTIELKKMMVDSGYMVTGTITITNPSAYPAELASVEDVAGGVMATVDCPSMTVPAYGTLMCTYTAGPLEKETFGDWNVVTVTPKDMTKFEGAMAKAEIDFEKAKIIYEGLDKVTLEDSYAGMLGEFSADATVTYTRTFTCDGDEGKHENTAWLQGTDMSDSAWVKVYCYVLEVKKDAKAHLTRTWEWMIDKVGDKSMLELEMGEKMMLHYMVTVSAMSKDSGWGVHGTIWVKNPAPIDAVITGVEDMISPDISATVDCGVTFPYTLPAGGMLTCSYEADLADGMPRTNTAKVMLKNSPTGMTEFSGWAEIDWSKADVTEYDECIDVEDDKYGFLGKVCAPQSPHMFRYELMVGPYDECGEYTFTNKAWFITNDTGTKGWDSWTVTITVPCMGCTLTQGYWKTHSEFGPAPYDETWSLLPMGASTPFYMSGQTWYEVFRTPTKGNAYYILAVQYMAARLNTLNGAGVPASVEMALVEAKALFEAYTPAQIAKLKGGDPLRAEFIRLAWILDQYNMGQMGIPHCDGDYMSKS